MLGAWLLLLNQNLGSGVVSNHANFRILPDVLTAAGSSTISAPIVSSIPAPTVAAYSVPRLEASVDLTVTPIVVTAAAAASIRTVLSADVAPPVMASHCVLISGAGTGVLTAVIVPATLTTSVETSLGSQITGNFVAATTLVGETSLSSAVVLPISVDLLHGSGSISLGSVADLVASPVSALLTASLAQSGSSVFALTKPTVGATSTLSMYGTAGFSTHASLSGHAGSSLGGSFSSVVGTFLNAHVVPSIGNFIALDTIPVALAAFGAAAMRGRAALSVQDSDLASHSELSLGGSFGSRVGATMLAHGFPMLGTFVTLDINPAVLNANTLTGASPGDPPYVPIHTETIRRYLVISQEPRTIVLELSVPRRVRIH